MVEVRRPKYQVFISSPFKDLEEERKAVIFEVLAARHIPVGMEGFPASDDRGWKTIRRTIDVSDYYVVILGGLYGSIDPETGLSWTEREYDYARTKGLKVLAFLRELKHVRGDMVETDPEQRAKFDAFRLKLRGAHLVKGWTNVDDLRVQVVQAVITQIQDDADDGNPRPGWYRGDQIPALHNLEPKLDEERARSQRLEDQLHRIDSARPLKPRKGSASERVMAEARVSNQTLTIGLARKPQGVDLTRLQFSGNLNANADGILKRVRFHECDDFLVESIILQGRSLFHGDPTEPALLDSTEFSDPWPNGPQLFVTLRLKSAT